MDSNYEVIEGTAKGTQEEDKKEKMKKTVKRIIAVLILLLLLLLGWKVFAPDRDPGNVSLVTGEQIIDPDSPTGILKNKYISYAGITDQTISSESVVELKNLEDNAGVVMKFEVYEGDNLLYETDYVGAGQFLTWEAGKDLSVGAHDLKLKQIPKMDIDGQYIPLTSGSCEFTLTKVY